MERAIGLGELVTEELRVLLGNRNFISAALAIAGTKSKVKTVAAVDYCIDGQIYHKAITDNLFVHTDLTVQAANTTKWYALCLDAAGAATIVAGNSVTNAALAAGTDVAFLPKVAGNVCIVGAIKIVTTSAFTPATTLHDAAGITTTYHDLSCVPTSGLPA